MKLVSFFTADGAEHIGSVIDEGRASVGFTAIDSSRAFQSMLDLIDAGQAVLDREGPAKTWDSGSKTSSRTSRPMSAFARESVSAPNHWERLRAGAGESPEWRGQG